MLQLILAALFFTGLHFFVAGSGLRSIIIERIGEIPYRVLFSLLSLGGLLWMIAAYRNTEYIELWSQAQLLKSAALVLMAAAFLLAVAGPHITQCDDAYRLSAAAGRAGAGNPARHPPSDTMGHRSVGARPRYRQRRCRVVDLLRFAAASIRRGNRFDRCQTQMSFRCSMGTVYPSDIVRAFSGHRSRPQPVSPLRNRLVAHSTRRCCFRCGAPPAQHAARSLAAAMTQSRH